MNKALLKLIFGFRRFKEKYYESVDLENSVYHKLASIGQTPKTLLIGCSDSRVDPAILTGAEPGELFVVRNVANLVPPCETHEVGFHGTSSALEFVVDNLKVENIIILGHRQCGGIRALMSQQESQSTGFINQWMKIAENVKKLVIQNHSHLSFESQVKLAEMESIKVSIQNLMSFPFVQKAIKERGLNIVGVYFDLEEGELWELDETTQSFRRLSL
jgi:carbonic anhydrase